MEASPKAVGRLPDRPFQSNRASVAQDAAGLGGARRRLSVMSDNTLIEGVDGISMDEKGSSEGKSGTVIREYSGVSKKGYAPYNPRKKNQDALVMCVRRRSECRRARDATLLTHAAASARARARRDPQVGGRGNKRVSRA